MKKILTILLLATSLASCNGDITETNNLNKEEVQSKKCKYEFTENDIDIKPLSYIDRDTELEYGYPIEYPKALKYDLKINNNYYFDFADKIEWRYNDETGKVVVVPATNLSTAHTFPKHDMYSVSLYINDAYCTGKTFWAKHQRHKQHPPTYLIKGNDLEFCIGDGNILDEKTVVKLKHTGYVGMDENKRLNVVLDQDKEIRQKCTIIPNFRKYIHVTTITGSGDYLQKKYGLNYDLKSTIEEYDYYVSTYGYIEFKDYENVKPLN